MIALPTSTSPVRGVPQYTDADVAQAVSMAAAISALRKALVAFQRGEALTIPKSFVQWEDEGTVSSAHALGAVDLANHRMAFKCWISTPRGASALLTLFDVKTGAVCAAMEAGELGMLRTAGAVGIATDVLAAPDADQLAILGTGRQAMHQVRAVAEVRRLREVRVWSPTYSHREDFADQITGELGIAATAHESASEAVRDAPIVTSITRARDPFLELSAIRPGTHLNAVGAILPGARELLPGVVEAADLVVVDDRENARRAATELHDANVDFDAVRTLGELLIEPYVRPDPSTLTIFKALGSGISDLAVAGVAYDAINSDRSK